MTYQLGNVEGLIARYSKHFCSGPKEMTPRLTRLSLAKSYYHKGRSYNVRKECGIALASATRQLLDPISTSSYLILG